MKQNERKSMKEIERNAKSLLLIYYREFALAVLEKRDSYDERLELTSFIRNIYCMGIISIEDYVQYMHIKDLMVAEKKRINMKGGYLK